MYNYCPRCGGKYPEGVGGNTTRSSYKCSECGFVFYNNPKPGINAIIFDDRARVLLARRAREPYQGRWGIPGGFEMYGEIPEKTLRRELREELGVEARIGPIVGAYNEIYRNHGRAEEAYSVVVLVYRAFVDDLARVVPGDDVAEVGMYDIDSLPPLAFEDQERFLKEILPRLRPDID